MTKEIDKYAANLSQLDEALGSANQRGVLAHMEMRLGDFLKMAAVNNIDLTAKCIRPADPAPESSDERR